MLTRRHFLGRSLATGAALALADFRRVAEGAPGSSGALAAAFGNPPREHAPMPWWTWDGDMDLAEMERQIVEIANCGVRGFYIFGLSGLKLEYLGEDWMERVRWAVRRGTELGLEVWIYDDFDWPTGLAKDRVIQRQELRQRAVFAATQRVRGPVRVTLQKPDGTLVAAAAAPRRGAEIGVAQTLDLTKNCGGHEMVWDAPAGEWDVFVFAERVLEGASFVNFYVDAFNPEATRYFIELTHEAYRRALGPELFAKVRGFFSDEPFFLNREAGEHSGMPLACAPWSPVLRDALKTPLAQTLVAVFADADRFGRGVRRRFYETATRLYAENFFNQRARWCAQHGQVLTGHEGGWISGGGDFARTLRTMQMPGMDWLGVARAEYPVWMIEAKVVSSLAQHAGKPAMMEGPGVFSWAQKLGEVRQSIDAFALYGFQSFTFNGFHYTVEGHRYYSPSALFYQSPHWALMPRLVRYSTRLVWALAQGKIPARVAVLWSPEMVWADERAVSGKPPGAKRTTRPEDEWQRGVEAAMSALMSAHIEFGVLDTTTLLDADLAGGKLRAGSAEYAVVVLPPLHALSLAAMKKLAAFHDAGGKLVALGALPTESDTPENDAPLTEIVAKLFGADAAKHDWVSYREGKPGAGAARQTGARSWFVEVVRKSVAEETPELLRKTVEPLVPAAWTLDGEAASQIFTTERVLADGFFLFLVNASDEASEAALQLAVPAQIERWDLLGGKSEPWSRQQSATTATINLAPREALLLRVNSSAPWQSRARRIVSKRRLPDRWQFRLARGNCAFSTPHWETSQRVINPSTTMGYRYRVQFPVREKPERLALLLDNADVRFHSERVKCGYECTLNGQPAPPLAFNQTFDRRMREFDLTALVQVGKNDLVLEYQHCAWLGGPVLPSMSLIGTFAVADGEIARAAGRETKAVSWTDLGHPHFSGAAVYAQSFEWQPTRAGARVLLRAAEIRDHARIRLNGQLAAELPWAPWEADITDFLRAGKNDLEIEVINTNANFVTQEVAPSGLLGAVTIVVEAA